ncbi:MAG TPA: biopolymer transporter ExbD [Flavobacterium sp.]|uniref:ExbD/TolR family protein n=1 Tax=unclassified Flavobacterium TaxID=196869 RepID=UPI000E96932F|nr:MULTISPECIES: biopolymer transporter ExbD [unclassified Flavobacterium]HBI01650.1 biopolymer transporter ExbD [Flavobacterium sp.]HRE77603.1 biopolymer transporter ExbD [Flavobacterium sp.]
MSKFKKKKGGDVPAISTASLPDIVFMLLFFFMVATVMKDNDLMIQNALPKADQVTKLEKKDRVMFIFAGKPHEKYRSQYGEGARIQLNDRLSDVSEIRNFVLAERAARPPELENVLTTSLKVDKEVKMGLVTEIKQELRKVEALKINYTTNQGKVTN